MIQQIIAILILGFALFFLIKRFFFSRKKEDCSCDKSKTV